MKTKDFWREKNGKNKFNKETFNGPKLPLILDINRISEKGFANVYKQLLNIDHNVIKQIE